MSQRFEAWDQQTEQDTEEVKAEGVCALRVCHNFFASVSFQFNACMCAAVSVCLGDIRFLCSEPKSKPKTAARSHADSEYVHVCACVTLSCWCSDEGDTQTEIAKLQVRVAVP